jgi:hypothetical protein
LADDGLQQREYHSGHEITTDHKSNDLINLLGGIRAAPELRRGWTMKKAPQIKGTSDPSFKPLMKNLAIELAIYAPLVSGYFFLALHFGEDYIIQLYNEMPVLYSIVGTLLILAQGVLLEAFTSWLLRRIGLR